MNAIVKAGVALGLVVTVWLFVYGFAGWYHNPVMPMVYVVLSTLILIGAVGWGLSKTASERGYGGQVVAGLLICLIGGAIIFLTSFIWGTAFFTDVAEVTSALQADSWADAGVSEEQIEQMLEATAFTRTPFFSALMGAIMTVITGLVVSLVAAAFLRQKA